MPEPGSRGWGPFREEWFSVCSRHRTRTAGCDACAAGQWKNILLVDLNGVFYRRFPRLWHAWANRPFLNPSRTFLEKTFPGLRRRA